MKIAENMNFSRIALSALIGLTAHGCVTDRPDLEPIKPDGASTVDRIEARLAAEPLDLDQRIRALADADLESASSSNYPTGEYDFQADGIDIVTAVRLFARQLDLNLIVDPDLAGESRPVSVSFHRLAFERAMEALIEAHGLNWEYDGQILRLSKYATRIFSLDYLKLKRSGKGFSVAGISSAESSGSSSATAEIERADSIDFWKDLESEIKSLLSEEGKLTINHLAGAIVARDRRENIVRLEKYLDQLERSIHRQVEIDVKIFELALSESDSLGIDWTRVNLMAGIGSALSLTRYSPARAPYGVATVGAPSVTLTYERSDFAAIVEALREQGRLKVISQPKILTMNNQPALIKSGVEQPYFTRSTSTSELTSEAGYDIDFVTVGVVMTVTPQIGRDGTTLLDISPIVSRLIGVSSVTDEKNVTLASAPVVEVKQTSTVARLKSDQMAVIGGIIVKRSVESERSVPLLGSIPGLGVLFRSKYKTEELSELVIFLTPRLLEGSGRALSLSR